jgi:leucyl-tRNA synthetase
MSQPDDPQPDDSVQPDPDGAEVRPARFDRKATEAKWQAIWAARRESSPAVRRPDDPPPLDLSLAPWRGPAEPEDPFDLAEDPDDEPELEELDASSEDEPAEEDREDAAEDALDAGLDGEISAYARPEPEAEAEAEAVDAPPAEREPLPQKSETPAPASVEATRRNEEPSLRPFYCLDMFPYPSTRGFSVNQLRGIAVTDAVARYQRARGRQVFRPIGWDSFGVGIENEASELGLAPHEVVEQGITRMRSQLERFGAYVHWDAEIRTSEPEHYRWTQWLFLKLLEQDLAVLEETPIKWCPSCAMNLANEEVSEGCCVHCGSPSEERRRRQWKVRTTAFADRLHQGLRSLKWPARVKALQRNWIGRKEGFQLILKAKSEFQEESHEFEVFTRRLEIVGECTYVLLAPEHPLIDEVCDELYRDDVEAYREESRRRTDRERLAAQGTPEGMPTGAWALNPITLQPMPIWVSASVLPSIGLGAILAHPPSDPRLKEFAEHFKIAQNLGRLEGRGRKKRRRGGRRSRSSEGGAVADLKRRARSSLDARGVLDSRTDFHLRDWIFARQRYWGEPIPVVHCSTCGVVPVPETDLPVRLPRLASAPETKPGVSPLSTLEDWLRTECPHCGGDAERETDTMPQWAASCWYYLRYLSPEDDQRTFDSSIGARWLPVNLCVGGIEHSILHLLYVRFFSYFFHDLGLTTREEPFRRLFNQGRIRAPGQSVEKGDFTAPHRGPRIPAEEILEKWGADVLRLHLLFLGPPSEDTEWSERGLRGCARFLHRAHDTIAARADQGRFVSRRALVLKHRLIRRVTRALRTFHLNKAVSAFMEFVRELRGEGLTPEEVDRDTLKAFVILLHPFAPHLACELWEMLGETSPLEDAPWPEYSDELLKPAETEIVIQVDDRVVDRLRLEEELSKTELLHRIEKLPRVLARTQGRRASRVVVVPDRLVNLIFREERPAAEAQESAPETGAGEGAPPSP